jgi:hypothetical protein
MFEEHYYSSYTCSNVSGKAYETNSMRIQRTFYHITKDKILTKKMREPRR